MKWFNVVHHDGAIQVRIDDDGYAILDVKGIYDHLILVQAINKALKEGARRGTLFTEEVVNDRLAESLRIRAERGSKWLGGSVTRLTAEPSFRIDWDEFPQITE